MVRLNNVGSSIMRNQLHVCACGLYIAFRQRSAVDCSGYFITSEYWGILMEFMCCFELKIILGFQVSVAVTNEEYDLLGCNS